MTVCIAARATNAIVGASDRMLTSADVQFEPSAGTKIVLLTSSMFVMTSGDAALQAEICSHVLSEITDRINREPSNWWRVKEAADLYIKYFNEVKNKRAEDAILAPLHLDRHSFIANQQMMAPSLVTDLTKELLNFELPSVSAIFAGFPTGAHIYTVRNNEANCLDAVGYAAIGIGSRHASSQFMFAGHAWNAPFSDTLLLTYYAKRKSEVAPGVGKGTDMVVVGPNLGSLISVGDHAIAKLDQEYNNITRSEVAAFNRAKGKIGKYVEELTRQAQAAGAASADTQTPSPADGGASPLNEPEVPQPSSKN